MIQAARYAVAATGKTGRMAGSIWADGGAKANAGVRRLGRAEHENDPQRHKGGHYVVHDRVIAAYGAENADGD